MFFAVSGLGLAACGGGVQNALSPTVAPQERALESPDGSSGALLYAGIKHVVEVYTFPGGTYQEAFKVVGDVAAMCSETSGTVFIAAAPEKSSPSGNVYEYAHAGKSPIATLDLPKGVAPVACSSDPATKNLAVTLQNIHNFAPSVAIYSKAEGTPKIYTIRALGAYPQAAYDDGGNLFVTSGGNVIAELRKGQTSFNDITLSEPLADVSHAQWAGKYLTLQSEYVSKHNREKLFERIYRVQITGAVGKIAGTTAFTDWPERDPGQSWIAGGTIVGTPYSKIIFWKYPAGGQPLKITHPTHRVKAVTISAGP
jgi:hypothetical protein